MQNLTFNSSFERSLWRELYRAFGGSVSDSTITTAFDEIMKGHYIELQEQKENWKQLYFLTTNEQGQLC